MTPPLALPAGVQAQLQKAQLKRIGLITFYYCYKLLAHTHCRDDPLLPLCHNRKAVNSKFYQLERIAETKEPVAVILTLGFTMFEI